MGNYFSAQSTTSSRIYGWRKSKHDERDHYHNFSIVQNHSAIKHVDMRDICPPIYDQGALGSCTANAIGAAFDFDMIKQKKSLLTPSRLFIYYNERAIEGTVNKDSGAEMRDGIKSLVINGVCPETMWPYDITKFTDKPTEDCYNSAISHKAITYKRVNQTLDQMKQCLINGFPFVFGFMVFESFESASVATTGIMPMPQEHEQILGGHAIMAVGFDDTKKVFICRNSWGTSWGDDGYFYMPYDFILNSEWCDDFWTIRKVEE